jgi:hypothetical protein
MQILVLPQASACVPAVLAEDADQLGCKQRCVAGVPAQIVELENAARGRREAGLQQDVFARLHAGRRMELDLTQHPAFQAGKGPLFAPGRYVMSSPASRIP